MSARFDVVIMCDLREDTPEEVIDAIRCLTSSDYELEETPKLLIGDFNIWEMFDDYHFLSPVLQNETISSFQRLLQEINTSANRQVYRWSFQFCGRQILDDIYLSHHLPFIYWLASIVYEERDGFFGYVKESYGELHTLVVKNGKLTGEYFNPPTIESDL